MERLSPSSAATYVDDVESFLDDRYVEVDSYRFVAEHRFTMLKGEAESAEDALRELEAEYDERRFMDASDADWWAEISIEASIDLDYSAVLLHPETRELEAKAVCRENQAEAERWMTNMNTALDERGFSVRQERDTSQVEPPGQDTGRAPEAPVEEDKTGARVTAEPEEPREEPRTPLSADPRYKYRTD
ncbi:MAG: hypothetical protein ABEJ07_02300 [Candidatus Nanohaloarchaea archaeon]